MEAEARMVLSKERSSTLARPLVAGNNFQRMKSDPNLYLHKTKKLYVLCYVDDLMVFGSDSDVSQLVTDLGKDLLAKTASELSEGNNVT